MQLEFIFGQLVVWFWNIQLKNKFKIKKFWKRINQELNAPPIIIYTLLLQVDHKNLFCTPNFY